MMTITLTGAPLAWDVLTAPLSGPVQVTIGATAQQRLAASRAVVDAHVDDTEPHYGINTGFGIFARTRIEHDDLATLQRNLVLSHAAGVGEPLPDPVVRTMLLCKLQGLCLGYSGVRVQVVEALAQWLAHDALPVIPSQGSVGASGDLAPLAHMALALLGEGSVRCGGMTLTAAAAIQQFNLPTIALRAKEGLGLLNGTQAMAALGVAALDGAMNAIAHADLAGAMTIEGLFGSVVPFDARLHEVRPHPGAQVTAQRMRALLAESAIVRSHQDCERVQDPYALRCIPAVHGAVRDAIDACRDILVREVNSVTDNPIVFPKENAIVSGGNFHGAPIALAMDHLAIAVTTLASMSERRIEQMINPKSGELAVMGLTKQPGLHSGFMVAHTTAASLVSENKTLAHPASVDTISTWGGQEDHVSMGMWGARKALRVVENAVQVIAIELLAAAQAIDLHDTRLKAGKGVEAAYHSIRAKIPTLEEDRFMAPDLERIRTLVASRALL
jgi:histidine ammonia-lyase